MRRPYKMNTAEPVGVPDMSRVKEGRYRWKKSVVVPLRMVVSLRQQSTSRGLTYLCCCSRWAKRGRSEGHYIRFFARSDSDCGYKGVRLENEMGRGGNEKLTNAVNIRGKRPTCGTRRTECPGKWRQSEEASVRTVALGRRGSASSAKATCKMMAVVWVS